MKTKHNIDRKYGIAYCRILKKKSFLKNEKVANRKLGNLGNLGNIIPSFLISKFSISKSDLKIPEKKFPVFRVFDLALILFVMSYMRHKNINYAKFSNSNLQLPAYGAHKNLQKLEYIYRSCNLIQT